MQGNTGLDLEALSQIDEQVVEICGQCVTMTSLVPADVEKCRRLVMTKKLSEELVMEYMTFLAMKKKHPEITWYRFQQLNFKTINTLMAVMATQNGFDETFRVFRESDGGSNGSASGDPEEMDFD